MYTLQNSSIQKKLFKYVFEGVVNISYSEITGIFPFIFSIKGLTVSNEDFKAVVDTIDIKISKSLTSIKNLDGGCITISLTKPTKFSLSDVDYLSCLCSQTIIKNATIKQLDAQGEILKNINFTYKKKIGSRYLSLHSRFGNIDFQWIFAKDNNGFIGRFSAEDIYANINYSIPNKLTVVNLEYKGKKFGFSGARETANTLTGYFSLPFNNAKVAGKITLENDLLETDLRSSDFKLSGNLQYLIGSKFIECYNFVFDDSLIIGPFSIRDDFTIPELNILPKKGKINFKNVSLSEDNFSLGNITFSDVAIEQFVDSKIEGTLNGSGIYENNTVKLKLKLNDFAIDELKIPVIDISAVHEKDKIGLNFVFNFLNKKNKIDAEIFTENWQVSKNSKISIKASGKFNIEDYKLPANQTARGSFVYDLNVGGTIANPIASGSINLKKGYYINQAYGTYLRDITLNCVLKNNHVTVDKLYTKDDSKTPGTLNGSGTIVIDDDKADANITIKVANLKMIDQNWIDTRLSGDLFIKGNLLKDAKISGLLYASNPKIDISSLVTLSSRAIELVETQIKQSETKSDLRISYPVNISVEIRPEIKIVGMGIDSSWTGKGEITNSSEKFNCKCTAILGKGKVNVQDNIFKLKNGEILFENGELDIKVSAEKHLENTIVGARFEQHNEESGVKFYSSPYLPEKDILSYMLFEKKSSEISTSEGLALFSIMNKATTVGGFDIINKIKTVLGIDSIGIKKNKDSANGEYDAVSIGKKIGKFRISVDQGAAKDTTNVVVETKIADNAKLSVDLSKRDSFGAGLLWSKRY
jgi:hypothetical protein